MQGKGVVWIPEQAAGRAAAAAAVSSTGVDEMDEIEAGVQADLKRGGLRVRQGGGVRFESP